ncbi:hypothetical protein PIB30_050515 [Stylosanthes scabra]|uniref:Uncharacterized protein n=1 Tax=Stylosanthes scabra TaxID=79078 RepID=A0ABU6TJV8_9FABA|nr:hypothetical protein [Stylosanthes scabra]
MFGALGRWGNRRLCDKWLECLSTSPLNAGVRLELFTRLDIHFESPEKCECCCGASCFLTSLSTAAWYSVNLWMITAGIGELMCFSLCPGSLLLVPPLLHPPLLDSLSVHHNRHCSGIFLTQDKDVRLGTFGLARTLKAYDFAYGCLKVTIARHAN